MILLVFYTLFYYNGVTFTVGFKMELIFSILECYFLVLILKWQ